MARVIEIVKAHLVANGFDGLVQTDAECGCLLDDLEPCGSGCRECEPGYRGAGLNDDDGDWAIYRSKDAALASVQQALARHEPPNVRVQPDPTARGNL